MGWVGIKEKQMFSENKDNKKGSPVPLQHFKELIYFFVETIRQNCEVIRD